jgi:hypothetical protein
MKTLDSFEALKKWRKDLEASAKLLGQDEGRYLVAQYYSMQEERKAADNRLRKLPREPAAVTTYIAESTAAVEKNIRRALQFWALEYRVGIWMQSLCGVGPVISAGCLAELDIRRAPYAGCFWSFAGLANKPWNKGEKRPYNADLKTLMFKAGDCFIKFQNHKDDFYGKYFVKRKLSEVQRNDSGGNKEAAAEQLATKNIKEKKTLAALQCGKLTDGHVNARARRWTAKMFLSHVHYVMHEDYYGKPPAEPYVFTTHCSGEHSRFVPPPNWPIDGGKSLVEFFETATDSQIA